ncbi:recombinase family protein [Actinophytocola sp.]|uniref:recombinase family protein n=1 Tax=Actinophytocola sp. TaxID=1872138 RepID=UPI003C7771AF
MDTFRSAIAYRRRRQRSTIASDGLRFAFYGRMSTSEFQDSVTSRAWQRAVADELVGGVGRVVAEFFDEGCSRRWSWGDRPAASALLAEAELPEREFDAVVVGEYERAFYGDQFRVVVERLAAAGVQVWLPEAGGRVELGSPVHEALMVLLGAQAQREVVRARHRVLAAMRVQVRVQGRFLGGRPPYGYRLADGGPHPNSVHARWGRRLHVLEPDPETAPWVEWIFLQRAAGRSVASLARELNERGVSCPSSADPGRNSHRAGERWIVRTVAMILENPRYTGRQVWNRQSTVGHGGGGRRSGRGSGAVRRNSAGEWEVSQALTHQPLVDDATFVAVQGIRAGRQTKDGETREYMLAGLVVCAVCGRRMDGHWVHGRAGYRCRHGYTSGTPRPGGTTRNLYFREDHLLGLVPKLLVDAGFRFDRPDQLRQRDLVDGLRRERLQIVCNREGPILKHEEPLDRQSASDPHGQTALNLDWVSRHQENDNRNLMPANAARGKENVLPSDSMDRP